MPWCLRKKDISYLPALVAVVLIELCMQPILARRARGVYSAFKLTHTLDLWQLKLQPSHCYKTECSPLCTHCLSGGPKKKVDLQLDAFCHSFCVPIPKSMILKCEWRGLKWPGILRKAFKFSFKAVRFKETHFRWSSWVWLRSFTRLSRSSIEWERRLTMPLLLYITRYDHFDFDVVDDKAGGKSFCA